MSRSNVLRTLPLVLFVVLSVATATTIEEKISLEAEEAVALGIKGDTREVDPDTNLFAMRIRKPNRIGEYAYIGATATISKGKTVIAQLTPEATACCLYFYFNPEAISRLEVHISYAHDTKHILREYSIHYEPTGI